MALSNIICDMCSAAFGAAILSEFLDIVSRSLGSLSQETTDEDTFDGVLQKSPNPADRTTSTLPASCPGRKEVSIMGRLSAAASAIVPGPAFVTRTSAATIHSAMFFTKDKGTTLTVVVEDDSSNSALPLGDAVPFEAAEGEVRVNQALTLSLFLSLREDEVGKESQSIFSSSCGSKDETTISASREARRVRTRRKGRGMMGGHSPSLASRSFRKLQPRWH